MLFAIDIGNTNLTIGLYDEQKLIFLARLATDTRRTAEQYALELNQIAEIKTEWFEDQATRDMFFRRLEEVKS